MSEHATYASRSTHAFEGETAGIVTRSVACVADGLVVLVILVAMWAGWSAVRFLTHPVNFTLPSPSWLLVLTTGGLVTFLYCTVFWSTSGRTYGDQLLGLRVVGGDRNRLHWSRSALRAAFCVVFPAGLFWAVVSPQNRSVQDVLLRTVVTYDWRPQAEPGPRSE